jgi:UDP-glucose:(heptosyl)LPS alpha-1,3-glucosyltransferase
MPEPFHPLRVLLAIGVYSPELGGASEWLQQYAAWLTRRGHYVSIVCERAETSRPFDLLTLPASRHTKNSWKRACDLQLLVNNHVADIVHDTGCLLSSDVFHPLMGSLIHNWRRQLRAYPATLRLRRFWHIRRWRDMRLQWHQRRRHRILVACSKGVATDFAQLGCNNSILIPNGIPLPAPATTEAVQQLRNELDVGNRLLILATATNFYLKGVMTVIRALSRLAPETRNKFLVIVTGKNQDGTFQEEVNRRGLQDCCRLLGWVKEIDAYYRAADIFLHPTYHDAGSLSTLKALATGCTVVTSRFDGSADWINNEIHGLILDQPENADALADILRRLLDAELRNRLSTAAQQLLPLLNQEHQFQQLEALYFNLRKIPRQ